MSSRGYRDELDRALARPDAELLCRNLDAYADYHLSGATIWPDASDDAIGDVLTCHFIDPDKALAYVVLGAARSDDPGLLTGLGCAVLEDILYNPSDDLLLRIVAQARRSARFRWLLNCPFQRAIAPKAWDALAGFRITGPQEEPSANTLPPRE